MQWSAIGTPLAIYSIHKISGLGFNKSTIWLSALAWLVSLLLIFCIFTYCSEWRLGLIAVFLALMLGKMQSFSFSGGTESFSQAALLLCIFITLIYIKKPSYKNLTILCIVSILGCFIRPHNQFFLLALGPCLYISSCKNRKKIIIFWSVSLIFKYLLSKSLHDPNRLSFPYLFSFLVSSEKYPGHDIFKIYMDGFAFSDLWSEKDQMVGKLKTGWYIMKMYWTGWLPALLVLFTSSMIGPFKAISRINTLILLAGIFFAATGHLVPRYWTITEPLVLVSLILLICPYFKKHLSYTIFIILLACFVLPFYWESNYDKTKQLSNDIPKEIIEYLNSKNGLIASSNPAKIINKLNREVLLLPKNTEVLNKINHEITPITIVVFCPDWKNSENKNWKSEIPKLLKLGYQQKKHLNNQWLVFAKYNDINL